MSKPVAINSDRTNAYVREAQLCVGRGDLAAAESAAIRALAMAPKHTGALVALARIYSARKQLDLAQECLDAAREANPTDATVRQELATVLAGQGRRAEAIALLREPPPTDAQGWFALGCHYDANSDAAQALTAARSALALSAQHAGALFLSARSHTALGEIDAAAAIYRQLCGLPASAAKAWFALLDLKTVRLDDDELHRLQRLQSRSGLDENERILAAFALGQACEQARRPVEAFRAFAAGNRRKRQSATWNAHAFSAHIEAIRRAFDHSATGDSKQGQEVIFLLGMPRSGTTLVERVLAAHPDVVGASELNDLPHVITAESRRRNQPFPDWVAVATDADWLRLGAEYLARTRRFQTCRRFTDKYPENWPYVGAIARMLPSAKILFCGRDRVETLWSCYKQLFAPGYLEWSYDFDSLAHYAADCARLWRHFATLEPSRCRSQPYEALVDDVERQARAMLAFVGLDFDPACLDFANQRRETRTASAAQVRQPLQPAMLRGDLYGELFAPLHDALARVNGISTES